MASQALSSENYVLQTCTINWLKNGWEAEPTLIAARPLHTASKRPQHYFCAHVALLSNPCQNPGCTESVLGAPEGLCLMGWLPPW